MMKVWYYLFVEITQIISEFRTLYLYVGHTESSWNCQLIKVTKKKQIRNLQKELSGSWLRFAFWDCHFVFFNVASFWKLWVPFTMNLSRGNFQSIILYDFRCGLSQQKSCQRLQLVSGNEALCCSPVCS